MISWPQSKSHPGANLPPSGGPHDCDINSDSNYSIVNGRPLGRPAAFSAHNKTLQLDCESEAFCGEPARWTLSIFPFSSSDVDPQIVTWSLAVICKTVTESVRLAPGTYLAVQFELRRHYSRPLSLVLQKLRQGQASSTHFA